ncbi:MAG: hypothetical protein ACT4N4_09720 [Rhodospirillales bacterium]
MQRGLWGTMSGDWGEKVLPRPKTPSNAVLHRDAPALAVLLAFAILVLAPTQSRAGEQLSAAGARLAHVVMQPGVPDLRRAIDLNGDQPIATYVTARTVGGALMMRTRHGYWLPWSGREDDLVDNGFTASGGMLEFKLLKESLPSVSLPVTVTVAYRTAAGVKFGMFEIRAP